MMDADEYLLVIEEG